jgi:hypothetical protein
VSVGCASAWRSAAPICSGMEETTWRLEGHLSAPLTYPPRSSPAGAQLIPLADDRQRENRAQRGVASRNHTLALQPASGALPLSAWHCTSITVGVHRGCYSRRSHDQINSVVVPPLRLPCRRPCLACDQTGGCPKGSPVSRSRRKHTSNVSRLLKRAR